MIRNANRILLATCAIVACGCTHQEPAVPQPMPEPSATRSSSAESSPAKRELTHPETLAWIRQRQAWRRARKTRPIWARAVTADEIGREFQTADRAKETAREGAWLCVGIADEPWFQAPEKIRAKYVEAATETKRFPFDDRPHEYRRFEPKPDVMNWAARIDGPEIAGFEIHPGYDPKTALHSEAGGYVVRKDTADPYQTDPDDVWPVQKSLFESTYEFTDDGAEK